MKPITYPCRPISGGTYTGQQLPGDWAWTPKLNGWRTLVHIPTGTMFNRHGAPLSISGEFTEALGKLRCTLDADAFQWADCEALERRHNIARGTLFVLDVIPEPKYEDATYTDRRTWLEAVLPIASINPELVLNNEVYLVPNDLAPLACWAELQALNRRVKCEFFEGLVAWRTNARYRTQLQSPDQTTSSLIKYRWSW